MSAPTPPATLAELFTGFLSIGARSFGGVMPWAYKVMVEDRRWLTAEDFTETIGLCQFLPGPNIGNASIVLGKRWFGWRGAIAAFFALMALPFVLYIVLATVYGEFAANPAVRAAVTGVGAAGAGLYIGTAIKLSRPVAKRPAALALIAGCFLAVAIARLSLLLVLPVAVSLALVLAFRAKL